MNERPGISPLAEGAIGAATLVAVNSLAWIVCLKLSLIQKAQGGPETALQFIVYFPGFTQLVWMLPLLLVGALMRRGWFCLGLVAGAAVNFMLNVGGCFVLLAVAK